MANSYLENIDVSISQEEDLEEEPPLPPIYIGNLHGQYISHIFVSTDEAVQHKVSFSMRPCIYIILNL